MGETALDDRMQRDDFGQRYQQSSAWMLGTSDAQMGQEEDREEEEEEFAKQRKQHLRIKSSENPIGDRLFDDSSVHRMETSGGG